MGCASSKSTKVAGSTSQSYQVPVNRENARTQEKKGAGGGIIGDNSLSMTSSEEVTSSTETSFNQNGIGTSGMSSIE